MENCQPKRRIRLNPIKKWTKEDGELLLYLLQRAGKNGIEKPTAQQFYTRIIEQNPALKDYSWKSARDRLKNLKIKYKAAIEWRSSVGAGMEDEDEAVNMKETLLKICPDFDSLDNIFSSDKVTDSQRANQNLETPSYNIPEDVTDTPRVRNYEASYNIPEDVTDTQRLKRRLEVPSNTSPADAQRAKRRLEMPPSSGNTSKTFLAELQQDRLSFYYKKLEIEKRKEHRALDLLERGQEIERMKIEMEREAIKAELMLKEKEIEMRIALEREKANQELELKKLELSLKYKSNNHSNT